MRSPPSFYRLISPFLTRGNSYLRHQFFILFFTFLCYVGYHMSRKPISVVKSVLHKDKCDTKGAIITGNPLEDDCNWAPFGGDNWSQLLGSLEYAYLFSYALFMFVSGHIAERMNLRHFLSWGMILSGLTTVAFGMGFYLDVHIFWFYLTMQLLAGIVQASGWPAVVAIMGNWFGKGRRGLIMGLWNSHTSVGNMLGSVLAGLYVSSEWGLSFIIPGVLTVLVGVLVALFMIPYPEDVCYDAPDDNSKNPQSKEVYVANSVEAPPVQQVESHNREDDDAISISDALRIPGVIAYACALFFAKLVSYTFLYWLPNYLSHAGAGMTPQRAADLSTVFDAGGILGGVAAGLISDRVGESRAATCAGMLAAAAPLLFAYESVAASQSWISTVLLFIVGGLVNGPYALITTAVSADLGTQSGVSGNSRALATVTAIIDGTGSTGAALGPLLTGLIVPTGWRNVFVMLVVSDLIAFLICIGIVVRNAKPDTLEKSLSATSLWNLSWRPSPSQVTWAKRSSLAVGLGCLFTFVSYNWYFAYL